MIVAIFRFLMPQVEAGYRSSAGVASNRMLAKLAAGLHKPDDQTVLLPSEAVAFVASLPLRALPGVGYRMEAELTAMGARLTHASTPENCSAPPRGSRPCVRSNWFLSRILLHSTSCKEDVHVCICA